MDYNIILNPLIPLISIVSPLIAYMVWKTQKRAMANQVMIELFKTYRSPEMYYAIQKLWRFYNYDCECSENNIEKEYLKIEKIEKEKINNIIEEENKFKEIKYTLDYQRRLVSHFYQHVVILCDSKILDKKVIYAEWKAEDLNIIPKIIIPMEEIKKEIIGNKKLKKNRLLKFYNNYFYS